MSLETELEILNNQVRQLMLQLDTSVKLLIGGKSVPFPTSVENEKPIFESAEEKFVSPDDVEETEQHPEVMDSSELPAGNIEWDNLDVMGCPFHSGMMSSSYKKAKQGKMKGCWNKIRSDMYNTDLYIRDRRVLIDQAKDRGEDKPSPSMFAASDAALAKAETVIEAAAPQAPLTAVPDAVDEPGISFTEVCTRHIAKHGDRQLGQRLSQCGLDRDYDWASMDGDENYEEVTLWIRQELIKHDAA